MCPGTLPVVAGKIPGKETMEGSLIFTFKLLKRVSLGFPIIAMIFGELSEESDVQIIFYYSDCIQQGQDPSKPSALLANPGALQAHGNTWPLATTNATSYLPPWRGEGCRVFANVMYLDSLFLLLHRSQKTL